MVIISMLQKKQKVQKQIVLKRLFQQQIRLFLTTQDLLLIQINRAQAQTRYLNQWMMELSVLKLRVMEVLL